MQAITIAGRRIGPGEPCFIIAEAGVNHNGDPALACELVDAAREAGADAVKFQTFRTSRLASRSTPKADYQKVTTGEHESQFEMLQRLEMSEAMHRRLLDHCRKRDILFLSSPFDEESADLLRELEVPALKIPSGEITNLPLLRHVAALGIPLILSTGMSFLEEVADAVRVIEQAGNPELILLHCLSNYPADPAECNLRAMRSLAAAFDRPVGYSDHTLGNEVSLAAVALGACVVEKHFTLDHRLPGPDHRASLEPAELAALVRSIRTVEQALGNGIKAPAAAEMENRPVSRKSIVAARDIEAGEFLTTGNLAVKRPGTGISPMLWDRITGTRADRNYRQDELIFFSEED